MYNRGAERVLYMTPLVEEKLVSYPRYTMTKWGFPKGEEVNLLQKKE
jgi:hypothetical protein